MKSSLLLITFLFSTTVHSQMVKPILNLTKDSDTLVWKQIITDNIKEFNLPGLNEKLDFVFRKWTPGSVLEITKHKDSISGKIIYFVFEVWEGDNKADKFVSVCDLSLETTKSIYQYIISSGFDTIPSEKYIKGWSTGFDGITHIYEIKDGTNYSFKNYWTPKIQKGIKEAKFINDFNKRIEELTQISKCGEQFRKDVPFPHYMYPGQAYSIIDVKTRKEWRKYNREREKRKQKNKR